MLILFAEYQSLEQVFNLEEKYEFLINEAKKKASAQQKSR
jgi:5-bromo-4-chloroindolyl phosphate hydrolysis protein